MEARSFGHFGIWIYCILVVKCIGDREQIITPPILRVGHNGSPMEVDSNSEESMRQIYQTPLNSHIDSPWSITTDSNAGNASIVSINLRSIETLTISEYDKNLIHDANESMECDIMNITGIRSCALCLKRVDYKKYAIVCDVSCGVMWHTECYLLYQQSIGEHALYSNDSISNVPYGDINNIHRQKKYYEFDCHQCKIFALLLYFMICIPLAIAILIFTIDPSYFSAD